MFKLTCESTVDITLEQLNKREIDYLPFHYYVNNIEYIDDLGKSMSYNHFYDLINKGAKTNTAQANVEEYINFFEKWLNQGYDILHLTLSTGLSGTYNSAIIASQELSIKYPSQKIYIVDSLAASSGYGMLMDTLADKRDEGFTIEEVRDYAEEIKLNIHHSFFSSNVDYYAKGGRISKTAGFFGTLFKICPYLEMNCQGKIVPRKKIRGKTNAIMEIIKQMELNINNGYNYNDKCYICNSDCYEDALNLKQEIEKRFPNLVDKIIINNIGTTIGSQCGPGTVAVFFYGKKRDRL